nr:integrase, catalytic region, zinc finger, CCHC-type, peptidase aspartic, catalytic [Tanacetum cinerariifolium]
YETSVANNTSSLVTQRHKASDYENPDPVPQRQDVYSLADADVPSQRELDLLFGPLYDELFNAEEGEQLQDDEFTNPFCAPAQEQAKSSSHNIGNSNVPTINQPQTRRQLATDLEMCMYALTVSTTEPKNIKEAMADSVWIIAMQVELHQFDRLQDSSFKLTAFSDADHTRCIDSRKIASRGIQFLGDKTEYQLADMFTKALPEDRFKYLVRRIGMRCLTPAELEVLEKETA